MIDPDDKAFWEAWYQANLECAQKCEQWGKEITTQWARRQLIDGAQRIAMKNFFTKEKMLEELADRGEAVRRMAKNLPKADLLEWIITDRLATVDAEIKRLEKLIAENQPAQGWQKREEPDHGKNLGR